MKTALQKNILTICLLVLTMGALNAQITTWTGGTSTDFSLATNWDTGVLPTGSDQVIIPDLANDPVLSTDYPDDYVDFITLNDGASLTVSASLKTYGISSYDGTLTIATGADFNMRNRAYFGNAAVSILNVTGGTMNVKSYFRVGNGADATINIDGGTVTCENTMFIGKYGGNGIININTGSLSVNNMDLRAGSVINIDEGSFVINTDKTADITTFVGDGRMAPVSGKTIVSSYDPATDKTTVTATPSLSLNSASAVTTDIKAVGRKVYVSNVKFKTDINIYSITGALIKTLSTRTSTNFDLKPGLWIVTVNTIEGAKSVKILCK